MDSGSDKSVTPKRILRIDPSKLNSTVQSSLKNALKKLKGPPKLGKAKNAPAKALPESKNSPVPDRVATPTDTLNQQTTATVTTPLQVQHVNDIQQTPNGNRLPEFESLVRPKTLDATRNLIRDRLEKRRLETLAKIKQNEARKSSKVEGQKDPDSSPPEPPPTDQSVIIKAVEAAENNPEENPISDINANSTIVTGGEGTVYSIQLLSEPLVIPITPEMDIQSIPVPVIISPTKDPIHSMTPPVIEISSSNLHLQDNCVPEPMDVDYELSPGTQSCSKISVIENVEGKDIDFMNMRVSQTNVSMISGIKKLNNSHDSSNDSEDFIGFDTVGEVGVSERTLHINRMNNKLDMNKKDIIEECKPEPSRDMDEPRKSLKRLKDVLTVDAGSKDDQSTGEMEKDDSGKPVYENEGSSTISEKADEIHKSQPGTSNADDLQIEYKVYEVLATEDLSSETAPPEDNPVTVKPVVRTQKLNTIPLRNLKLKPAHPKRRSKGGAKIRPSLMSVAVNLHSPSIAVKEILNVVAKELEEEFAQPVQLQIEENVELPTTTKEVNKLEEKDSESENILVMECEANAAIGQSKESEGAVSGDSTEKVEITVDADTIGTADTKEEESAVDVAEDTNEKESPVEHDETQEAPNKPIADPKPEIDHPFRTPSRETTKNFKSPTKSSLGNRRSVMSILKNSPSFKKLCEELKSADNFSQTDTEDSDEESITMPKRLFEKLFSKELALEMLNAKSRTEEVPVPRQMEETKPIIPVDNLLTSTNDEKSVSSNITEDENPVAIPVIVNNSETEATSEEPPRTEESPLPTIEDSYYSEEEDIESPLMEPTTPVKHNIAEESPAEECMVEILVNSELPSNTEDLGIQMEVEAKPHKDVSENLFEVDVEVVEEKISDQTPETEQILTEAAECDPVVKSPARKSSRRSSVKKAGELQLKLVKGKLGTVRKLDSEVEDNDPPVVEEKIISPAIETRKTRRSRSNNQEWNIVKSPIKSTGKENAEKTYANNKLLLTLKRPTTRRMSVALRKEEEELEQEPPKKRGRMKAAVDVVKENPQPAEEVKSVERITESTRTRRKSTIKAPIDEEDTKISEIIKQSLIRSMSNSVVLPSDAKELKEQLEGPKATPPTVQAKIHNFFAPKTKSLASKPRTENTCGNCKEVVPVREWRKHVTKHNGLAWIDGLENKINLSCHLETARVVQHFMVAHKVTKLTCELCNAIRRSAAGLISHIRTCGKSSEEVESEWKVPCQHCNVRVLPYSLYSHYKFCSVLAAVRQAEIKESVKEEKSSGDDTVRTSGRGRVLKKTNLNNSLSAGELREHYSKKIFNSRIHRKWQSDSERGSELKCFSNECKFKTNELREMETHHNTCELAQLNKFACKVCRAETKTQEEMVSHLTKDHFSEDQGDSEADPFEDQSEDASVGSESSDPEGSSGVDEDDGDYSEGDDSSNQGNNRFLVGRQKSSCPSDPFIKETALPKFKSYAEDYNAFKEKNFSTEPLFTHWMPPTAEEIIVLEKDFEGNSEERSSTYVNIQCGLIIDSISWVPMSDENQQQILALLCKPKDLPYITMRHKEPVDTIIQLWSVNAEATFSATFLYSISRPNGPICAMRFCPSGGQSKKRLGLMALTSVSGDVNIVALPVVHKKWQGKAVKLPANVVLKANVDSIGTTLDWDTRKGHEIIMSGFMDGMVVFWRLNSSNSKLRLNDNREVLPFRIFQPFTTPISALAMNNNYFLVMSGPRLKVYEMAAHGCTEMTSLSIVNISSAKWVPNSPYLLVGMQRASSNIGAFIVLPFTTARDQVRLLPTTSVVTAVSYSSELKLVLGGTERGDIWSRAMDQKSAWYHGGQFTKKVSTIRNGVVYNNSTAKEKPEVNSTELIKSIEFNPTTKYKEWYAVGYEKGLVRVNKMC